MTQKFEEASIPSTVWAFAKKNTGSLMTAGILAFIIWQFLKKNKVQESYDKIDKMFSEDNDMSNSGDFVGTKMAKKDEDKQTKLDYKQYSVTFFDIDKDDKKTQDTEVVSATSELDAKKKVISKGRQFQKIKQI